MPGMFCQNDCGILAPRLQGSSRWQCKLLIIRNVRIDIDIYYYCAGSGACVSHFCSSRNRS